MEFTLTQALILTETLARQLENEQDVKRFPPRTWEHRQARYLVKHGPDYRFSNWFPDVDSPAAQKLCQRAAARLASAGLLTVAPRMTHLKLTDAGRDAAAKLLAELTPAPQATDGEPAQGTDHQPNSDSPAPEAGPVGTPSGRDPAAEPNAPHEAPASD